MGTDRETLFLWAQAELNLDVTLVPVPAAYGSPGRVICFGKLPDFMCKTLPIAPQNVNNVESVKAAITAFLDPWYPDDKFDEAWLMGVWMGAEIRFMYEEDETGKVVFA